MKGCVDLKDTFHLIIPARMASERLPGKPLALIQGVPMVIRVAKVCIEVVGIESVSVSTPDDEIIEVCKHFNVPAVYSSIDCKSGSDRIYEFAKNNKFQRYVNIQGDEPLLPAKILKKFLFESFKLSSSVVGISKLVDPALVQSDSVVKIANSNGRIVYASRSALANSSTNGEINYYKHTGLYSYLHEDILTFGASTRGSLESAENIEILRLIECGVKVQSVEIENYGRAVDTERDLQFVETYGNFSNKS